MDDKITVYLNDETISATMEDDTLNATFAEYVTFEQKDYNKLNNKPKINGVTLQGDKSAVELRLVPTRLSPFQAVEKPTRSFRQTAEVFVDDKDNGARMTLQAVKSMGTKIVTTENMKNVDFDLLDKGDFVYINKEHKE